MLQPERSSLIQRVKLLKGIISVCGGNGLVEAALLRLQYFQYLLDQSEDCGGGLRKDLVEVPP